MGFGWFTLYLKDEHMAHFLWFLFLHHYKDITPGCGCLSLYDVGSDAPFACPCLSRSTQDKQWIKKEQTCFYSKEPVSHGFFPSASDQWLVTKKQTAASATVCFTNSILVPKAGLEPARFEGAWFWVKCVCQFRHFGKRDGYHNKIILAWLASRCQAKDFISMCQQVLGEAFITV